MVEGRMTSRWRRRRDERCEGARDAASLAQHVRSITPLRVCCCSKLFSDAVASSPDRAYDIAMATVTGADAAGARTLLSLAQHVRSLTAVL
jgi:hypothetical protein